MFDSKLSVGLAVLVVAFLCSKYIKDENRWEDKHNSLVLKAWATNISLPSRKFSRISIGTNACLDLIVRGVDLLKALSIEPGSAKDSDVLHSLEELQAVYNYFFNRGAAAERYFANSDIFRVVTNVASKLDHKQVQLMGPIGPRTRSLLHPRIIVPESAMVSNDEIHLIMEHQVGDNWGDSFAPVATRFITSHDESNSKLLQLEKFFLTVDEFRPDLIVFSGLHMLEGQSEEMYEERVRVLSSELDQVSPKLPVHLELASMANAGLLTTIVQKVFHKVTAIGLNEQELMFISHVMVGPHKDLYQGSSKLQIHHVVEMIAWMLQDFGYSHRNPESHLCRIHFHTLTFHIIGIIPNSWENVPSAVAAGTRSAGQQACDTNDLDPSSIELLIPQNFKLFEGDSERRFDPLRPVISFKYQGFDFSLSPVLVCKEPLKTVGLGDSISAIGLLYSVYNPQYR